MPTDKLQILTPIVTSVNGNTGDVTVATKTSELENDSGFATTTYVDTKVANLVDSAPETLDTLNELSAALGDDPNFATTVANQIGTKQDKITATGVLQGDGKGNITTVESIGADIVTLDKSDVGLGNVDNVKQYSVSNPPPYPVTSVAGKTGAVTLAKGDVGLGNVDNTSDANKPISTATQTALDTKQDKITASGILQGDGTGNVTAAGVDLVEITPDTIGAQSKITASGLLKGDGSGGVTAAVANEDYKAYDANEICFTNTDLQGLGNNILTLGYGTFYAPVKESDGVDFNAIVPGCYIESTEQDVDTGHVVSTLIFGKDAQGQDAAGSLLLSNTLLASDATQNASQLAIKNSSNSFGIYFGDYNVDSLTMLKLGSDPDRFMTQVNPGSVEDLDADILTLKINKENMQGETVIRNTQLIIPYPNEEFNQNAPLSPAISLSYLNDQGYATSSDIASAVKGTTASVTLASASWGGTAAPYTYTISNSAITTTSTQEVLPSTDITADQLTALQEANIIDGGQAAGSMTLKAFGEKPSIDIPIRVVIKG